MSSIYEGLPSSLIEALALDKPCVSTDFKSGAREILAPDKDLFEDLEGHILQAKYGILSPVCDGVEYDATHSLTEQEILLGNAIESILFESDLSERYINTAHDAIKTFSLDGMVNSYLDLI